VETLLMSWKTAQMFSLEEAGVVVRDWPGPEF
jgi:hypothetical protein